MLINLIKTIFCGSCVNVSPATTRVMRHSEDVFDTFRLTNLINEKFSEENISWRIDEDTVKNIINRPKGTTHQSFRFAAYVLDRAMQANCSLGEEWVWIIRKLYLECLIKN